MNIINVGLTFKNYSYGNMPHKIILHNADATGCTVQDIHQWHLNNGWAGIGYHYYVRKDGSIYKGRPDNVIGSHCKGYNIDSLGICFEGRYMEEVMPQEQYNAGIELIKYLYNRYGKLPIFGHKDFNNTDCPGKNFPLDNFKALKQGTDRKLGWNKTDKGWWYCTDIENGYFYTSANGWQKIDDKWYIFDDAGYALCQKWYQEGDKWYYLKADCTMASNEWCWISDECYHFETSGVMSANTYTVDGWFVDKDGCWDSTITRKAGN